MKRLALLMVIVIPVLSSACAGVTRKDLGEVQVRVNEPILNTQLFDYANFRVEEGRLFATSPSSPAAFDLSVMDDGCLRGGFRAQLYFCATAPTPDENGVRHWRSVGGRRQIFFSTLLKDDGRTLEIEAANLRAEVALGNSAAHAEIRKHPELIGAAFARGLFPASKNGEGSDWDHKEWKYVLTQR